MLGSNVTLIFAVLSYDVDFPIECDDEYWENDNPALAFKQPRGKPSQVSYFNHLIKINLLHSHALRTIVSTLTSNAVGCS